jgi:hypothetical protein
LEEAVLQVARADTVGDLVGGQHLDDATVGHVLASLAGLQNHQLVAFYGDGPDTARAFFTQEGQLRILGVNPPAK